MKAGPGGKEYLDDMGPQHRFLEWVDEDAEFEKWDALLPALAAKLHLFAAFNDCDEIRVDGVSPGKVKAPLRRALRKQPTHRRQL